MTRSRRYLFLGKYTSARRLSADLKLLRALRLKTHVQRSRVSIPKTPIEKAERTDFSANGFNRLFLRHFPERNTQPLADIGRYEAKWEQNFDKQYSAGIYYDFDSEGHTYAEPSNTYFLMSGASWKVTSGFQRLSWGRLFENSILDRFNRLSFRHGPHFPLEERSLNQLAVRPQIYWDNWSFDIILIPYFRTHMIPDHDELWAPIRKSDGALAGVDTNPIFSALIRHGAFKERSPDRFAGGIRVNFPFGDGEGGLTYAHSSSLLPYYEINPVVLAALQGGADPQTAIAAAPGDTFRARYPTSSFFAFDTAQEWREVTYRLEVGYLQRTPYTERSTFLFHVAPALTWNLSAEFYPRSGKDTFHLILSGLHLEPEKIPLEPRNRYSLAAMYLMPVSQDRWQLSLKGRISADPREASIMPAIAFKGYEPHVIEVGGDYYDGKPDTLGGYSSPYSNVMITWKSSY